MQEMVINRAGNGQMNHMNHTQREVTMSVVFQSASSDPCLCEGERRWWLCLPVIVPSVGSWIHLSAAGSHLSLTCEESVSIERGAEL